jgi:hypothetical protein
VTTRRREQTVTTRDQFSDEEWAQVAALPGLVIIGASISDGHTLPAVREVKAGGEALTEGLARYPENAILQAFTAETTKKESDKGKGSGSSEESPEDVRESMAEGIEAGVAVLRVRVTVEEFEQISEVLVACARAVAERLGSGFMGSGDEKVSPGEQAFVDRLASIFRLGA